SHLAMPHRQEAKGWHAGVSRRLAREVFHRYRTEIILVVLFSVIIGLFQRKEHQENRKITNRSSSDLICWLTGHCLGKPILVVHQFEPGCDGCDTVTKVTEGDKSLFASTATIATQTSGDRESNVTNLTKDSRAAFFSAADGKWRKDKSDKR